MDLDFNRRLSIAPMLDCTDRHERFENVVGVLVEHLCDLGSADSVGVNVKMLFVHDLFRVEHTHHVCFFVCLFHFSSNSPSLDSAI